MPNKNTTVIMPKNAYFLPMGKTKTSRTRKELPEFPAGISMTPSEAANLSIPEYYRRVAAIQHRLSADEIEKLHVFRIFYRRREQNRRHQRDFRARKQAEALLLLNLACVECTT
jgi:hypothetical protein